VPVAAAMALLFTGSSSVAFSAVRTVGTCP
jgi:hypothetical protein